MNNKEALKYWQTFLEEIDEFKHSHPKMVKEWKQQEQATEIAIKSIETHIPKSPKICQDYTKICPVCGSILNLHIIRCGMCGQLIEWSE